jgi:hypothetical protein
MLSGKKIVVLMGGPGSERAVSLASGEAVLEALLGLGLDAVALDVTSTDIDLPDGTDLAFNVIHGTFGEDGQLQDVMEKLGVPYTGAGSASSKLAIHKSLAKEKFLAAGVPTARSETGSAGHQAAAGRIERRHPNREVAGRGHGRAVEGRGEIQRGARRGVHRRKGTHRRHPRRQGITHRPDHPAGRRL